MRRIILSLAATAGLIGAGCDKGTSVAPSTNPAKPDAERKLTVTSPGEQNITQDKTDEMTISINRDRFSGPVDIELRNLPAGITVTTTDLTIPADKGSATVTIKAAATAAPADDHMVTVAAKAKDQKDLPEATTTFKLDVKSK